MRSHQSLTYHLVRPVPGEPRHSIGLRYLDFCPWQQRIASPWSSLCQHDVKATARWQYTRTDLDAFQVRLFRRICG